MERHEFDRQHWSWDEEEVAVRDLQKNESRRIAWDDVLGIGRSLLRLEDGKGILFIGKKEEVKSLRADLAKEWKVRAPHRWVAAVRRSARATRTLFAWFFPVATLIFGVAPWLTVYGYLRYKGVADPEIDEKCIRGALLGTAIFIGLILFYLLKIRGVVEELLCEADKVAKAEDC